MAPPVNEPGRPPYVTAMKVIKETDVKYFLWRTVLRVLWMVTVNDAQRTTMGRDVVIIHNIPESSLFHITGGEGEGVTEIRLEMCAWFELLINLSKVVY